MLKTSAPLFLRIWMVLTWCLALPMGSVSRYLHRRMGADPARFCERLGRNADGNAGRVLWFHAASLGEVKQIGLLAADLHQTAGWNILVTTTTATGAEWVAREMPFAQHRFAPIDTPAAVRRFVAGWSPAAAIFVEGDLWPRMQSVLHTHEIPRILLNARHSRTRERLSGFYGHVLGSFALITCRAQSVASGILALGVDSDRVRVLPDLRLTLAPPTIAHDTVEALSAMVGSRPVWLAASTHPSDEEAVVDAHRALLEVMPDALCIIAPRHPARGEALNQLCVGAGIDVAQRSLERDITTSTQIYIADTLGELGALYTLAPLAFLGGSFGSEGGHTPYEPAWCGTAILYGPKVANFAEAYAALAQEGAAVQVDTPSALAETLVRLMDGGDLHTMARAGSAYMATQQTCTQTYAETIKTALASTSAARPK